MAPEHQIPILVDLVIDLVQVWLERGVDVVDVLGLDEAAIPERLGTRGGGGHFVRVLGAGALAEGDGDGLGVDERVDGHGGCVW